MCVSKRVSLSVCVCVCVCVIRVIRVIQPFIPSLPVNTWSVTFGLTSIPPPAPTSISCQSSWSSTKNSGSVSQPGPPSAADPKFSQVMMMGWFIPDGDGYWMVIGWLLDGVLLSLIISFLPMNYGSAICSENFGFLCNKCMCFIPFRCSSFANITTIHTMSLKQYVLKQFLP